jgi:thioredoxin 1
MTPPYAHTDLTREEVDGWSGAAVVEFGTDWCGYCQAAQPLVAEVLAGADVKHVKVEDGPGRKLGRSYRVKLWPTLVFLKNGLEQARVVRPESADDLRAALSSISP